MHSKILATADLHLKSEILHKMAEKRRLILPENLTKIAQLGHTGRRGGH